jgi:hypothetical protein
VVNQVEVPPGVAAHLGAHDLGRRVVERGRGERVQQVGDPVCRELDHDVEVEGEARLAVDRRGDRGLSVARSTRRL